MLSPLKNFLLLLPLLAADLGAAPYRALLDARPSHTPVCASYPRNGAALFVVETRARGAETQPVSPRITSLRFLAF